MQNNNQKIKLRKGLKAINKLTNNKFLIVGKEFDTIKIINLESFSPVYGIDRKFFNKLFTVEG